jgi:hypothetical protein
MRSFAVALAAFALLAMPVAQAQSRRGGSRPVPPPAPPGPTQTVPPPIVYPFPPLMTPPAGGLTPRGGPDNRAFRPDRRSPQVPIGGYVSGPYYGYADSLPVPSPQSPARASGWLRLAVTPVTAQVFVDAYYVGTANDVNAKGELQLDAGPHRIRFTAPQYQALSIDVQIAPNDTLTYRGALEPVLPAPPPAPRAASASSTPMYMIPNCYMGNVPPRASRLPAGCDIKQVQVLRAK